MVPSDAGTISFFGNIVKLAGKLQVESWFLAVHLISGTLCGRPQAPRRRSGGPLRFGRPQARALVSTSILFVIHYDLISLGSNSAAWVEHSTVQLGSNRVYQKFQHGPIEDRYIPPNSDRNRAYVTPNIYT